MNLSVYGKVKSVKKSSGDSLIFYYDATGNRIMKKVKTGTTEKIYYYIKDASGNTMSMYTRQTSGSNYVYKQTEVSIYGSDRVGLKRMDQTVLTVPTSRATFCFSCAVTQAVVNTANLNGYYSRTIAQKEYEGKDHLGNVRVIVSDRRTVSVTSGTITMSEATMTMYANYYAFGMEMVGKTYSASDYRYGFNGKEKDDEISGSGNQYDYGFRIYNPRLGRFLSVDPLARSFPHFSPYLFSNNSPILLVDIDGLSAEKPITLEQIKAKLDDGRPAKGYSVAIFVDQPVHGSNDQFNIDSKGVNVGHTFIRISKWNEDGTVTTAVFGWYPADAKGEKLEGSPINKEAPGTFNDDTRHEFDVSVTKYNVTEKEIQKVFQLAEQYESKKNYELDNCNCTTFGNDVAKALGVSLPETLIDIYGPPGEGLVPGQMGQDIIEGKLNNSDPKVKTTTKVDKAYDYTTTENKKYKTIEKEEVTGAGPRMSNQEMNEKLGPKY